MRRYIKISATLAFVIAGLTLSENDSNASSKGPFTEFLVDTNRVYMADTVY
ncbi:MAG: hypothetical protein AB1393_10880 [Candidatus Edwardsbacteria bacterium]